MFKLDIKKIKIQTSDIECFKIELLKILSLYNYKQNCLIDFEDRLDNYFKRNSNLKIHIEIKKKKLFDEIYNKKFSELERYRRRIPENYPWGASNMETQTYYDPIVCDKKYYDDVEIIKTDSLLKLQELTNNYKKLERKEKLEIFIK